MLYSCDAEIPKVPSNNMSRVDSFTPPRDIDCMYNVSLITVDGNTIDECRDCPVAGKFHSIILYRPGPALPLLECLRYPWETSVVKAPGSLPTYFWDRSALLSTGFNRVPVWLLVTQFKMN